MSGNVFGPPFLRIKNTETSQLGGREQHHEPDRDPEHPVGRRCGRNKVLSFHMVRGSMPWIPRGAKAFKLCFFVLVLVIVLVIEIDGQNVDHEQEQEHDYERENLPRNIGLA